MDRHNQNKDNGKSKLIGLALVVLFTMPQLIVLFMPIGIVCGIVYLVTKSRKSGSTHSRTTQRQIRDTTYTPAFDECPKGFFCFHGDKGEHHVRKGKEIDPWDRPDIDISKYQRRG